MCEPDQEIHRSAADLDEMWGTITSAWDDLCVPPEPKPANDDLESALEAKAEYVKTLTDNIRSLAAECNKQTKITADLASANVRQTQIIADLRKQVGKLRGAVMQFTLSAKEAEEYAGA